MAYKDWQELAEKGSYIPNALIDSIDYAERIIDIVAEAHGDSVDHIALEISKVLIKKAEYYRWHDLRKNPEDVSEFYHDVIVAIDCGDDEYDYEVSHYGVNSPFNPNPCRMWAKDNVIAWREIEPFEGENEI